MHHVLREQFDEWGFKRSKGNCIGRTKIGGYEFIHCSHYISNQILLRLFIVYNFSNSPEEKGGFQVPVIKGMRVMGDHGCVCVPMGYE